MAGGGLLGAIAGGQKDTTKAVTESSTVNNINLRSFDDLNKGRSGLEEAGYNQQVTGFADLQKLLGFGPGQNEVQANTTFQNDFASTLQQLLGQITNPTQQSINQNFGEAQQLFAPQQTALNQQFQDQNIASNRLSARLGRAGNDPILRNKLAQEQTRQQSSLNSEIGSYSRQLPQIRGQQAMDLGGQLSNLRQGLATQALQNRSTLLSMGNELANSERNYRLQTAQRTNNGYSSTETTGGGGAKGAIAGGFGGAGTGAEIAGMF